MGEEDPRWTRSRTLLLEAISGYLDAGFTPSITEITTSAGVSRPTFYQHFGDLATAYTAAAVERMNEQFALVRVPAEPGDADESFLLETLTQLLSHQLEHREFYLTVIQTGTDTLTESLVAFLATRLTMDSPFATQFSQDDDAVRDRVTALAAGVVWLAHRWLEELEPRPAPAMARRVLDVITSSFDATSTPALTSH